MKANVKIADYVYDRYNSTKLEKLKNELQRLFNEAHTRSIQEFPEEGIEVSIIMSAKYQKLYIKCENWGNYQSVGEFEDIIKEALENRCFEETETEWEDDSFKIWFE